MMEDRLQAVERRYEDLSSLLADPETIGNPEKLREVSREHSRLTEVGQAGMLTRNLAQLLRVPDRVGICQEAGEVFVRPFDLGEGVFHQLLLPSTVRERRPGLDA